MVSIVTLRANFCTLCTDPSWRTAAKTIVATTLAPVHTLAMLAAVHAVRTNRAGNGAVFACPTRQTLTGTCNMVAVSTIFARALLKTVQSVCSDRTRMFTREPNVAGPTHIFSGNMVTSPVSIYHVRTFLLAAKPIVALFTWGAAVFTLPTTCTGTQSSHWVTRAVVLTFTDTAAVLAIVSRWTACLTLHPTPLWLTQTCSSHWVTANAVVIMTVTHKAALQSKPS